MGEGLGRGLGLGTAIVEHALDVVQVKPRGGLLGMVADAPRRATMFGGLPLPSRPQIEARVRKCVGVFLRGYRAM